MLKSTVLVALVAAANAIPATSEKTLQPAVKTLQSDAMQAAMQLLTSKAGLPGCGAVVNYLGAAMQGKDGGPHPYREICQCFPQFTADEAATVNFDIGGFNPATARTECLAVIHQRANCTSCTDGNWTNPHGQNCAAIRNPHAQGGAPNWITNNPHELTAGDACVHFACPAANCRGDSQIPPTCTQQTLGAAAQALAAKNTSACNATLRFLTSGGAYPDEDICKCFTVSFTAAQTTAFNCVISGFNPAAKRMQCLRANCNTCTDGTWTNSHGHDCAALRQYAQGGQRNWSPASPNQVTAGEACYHFSCPTCSDYRDATARK
jgi:hypothetical protein